VNLTETLRPKIHDDTDADRSQLEWVLSKYDCDASPDGLAAAVRRLRAEFAEFTARRRHHEQEKGNAR
jgi:hypothetical protein